MVAGQSQLDIASLHTGILDHPGAAPTRLGATKLSDHEFARMCILPALTLVVLDTSRRSAGRSL